MQPLTAVNSADVISEGVVVRQWSPPGETWEGVVVRQHTLGLTLVGVVEEQHPPGLTLEDGEEEQASFGGLPHFHGAWVERRKHPLMENILEGREEGGRP